MKMPAELRWLDYWIEREFSGYGMAMRGKNDPPIPGEPLMSMEHAKDLTRRAVMEAVYTRTGEIYK